MGLRAAVEWSLLAALPPPRSRPFPLRVSTRCRLPCPSPALLLPSSALPSSPLHLLSPATPSSSRHPLPLAKADLIDFFGQLAGRLERLADTSPRCGHRLVGLLYTSKWLLCCAAALPGCHTLQSMLPTCCPCHPCRPACPAVPPRACWRPPWWPSTLSSSHRGATARRGRPACMPQRCTPPRCAALRPRTLG